MVVVERIKCNGLVFLEPVACAYDTPSIVVAIGVLKVKSNLPFLVLVATFGDTSKQLKKNQKIRTVYPHSNWITPTDLNVTDILRGA